MPIATPWFDRDEAWHAKRAEAVRLWQEGATYREVGVFLGLSPQSGYYVVKTSGATRPAKPRREASKPPKEPKRRTWTEADVVQAIRECAEVEGGALTLSDYRRWSKGAEVPSLYVVRRRFETWEAACEAAGVASRQSASRLGPASTRGSVLPLPHGEGERREGV